jgi:hypothetical protein
MVNDVQIPSAAQFRSFKACTQRKSNFLTILLSQMFTVAESSDYKTEMYGNIRNLSSIKR